MHSGGHNTNAVFGTVSGPTIFNALRIGRAETDEATHTPLDMPNATRIKSVKIVENPIHEDLVPQPQVPWRSLSKSSQNDAEAAAQKKRKKRKGKFDTNVLSFGDEFQEEDTGPATEIVKMKGMKSSHDLVESKVLSKQVDEQVKEVVMDGVEKDGINNNNGDSESFSKKRRLDSNTEHDSNNQQQRENEDESAMKFSSRKGRNDGKQSSSAKDEDSSREEKMRETKERNATTTNPSAPKQSLVEIRRLKYTKGKKSKKEREEETLAKLMSFRSTIQQEVEVRKSSSSGGKAEPQDDSLAARMARKAQKANGPTHETKEQAPTYHGQVLESDDEEAANQTEKKRSWLGTAFKCSRHMDDDKRGGDGRAADDYELIDTKKHRGDKKHKHHRHHDRDHKGSKHKHHRRDK